MEHTLVIIKPDGVQRKLVGRILQRFEDRKLRIVQMRQELMTTELAEQHYQHLADKPFFHSIINYMTSGPVIFIVLEGDHAIEMVRTMVGETNPLKAAPGTIRGDFAMSTSENIIHASDSSHAADVEIDRFFHHEPLRVPVIF
ncbi:MAG: nucleoside-diphosphate kinase [Enterococcus sp.]